MPAPVRKRASDIQVWTLDGTSLLCNLEEADLSVEHETEDGRGACDEWSYTFSLARKWSISYSGFVAEEALLVAEAAGANNVAVVFNTGANTYQGTGTLTSGNHKVSKGSLQREGCTIEGFGPLTIVAS